MKYINYIKIKQLFFKYYYFVIVISTAVLIILLIPSSPFEEALRQAGRNRQEFDKVLSFYRKNQKDSLKLSAAKFLIENMPGNFSYDSSKLYAYRKLLYLMTSLDSQYILGAKINVSDSVNKRWDEFKARNWMQYDIFTNLHRDILSITANYLLHDIDLSFKAWQENPFSDSITFDDFKKFILPYRRQNGLVIEDWRDYFRNKYAGYFIKNHFTSVKSIIDSIMNEYNSIKLDWNLMPDFPYIRLKDYLLSKKTRCAQRCWFNSMLFSSLGLPVGIDFVPAWANKDYSHSWNVLILKGIPYPFESTGGIEKWEIKKIYNNEYIEPGWDKFKLPKVFRYSFVSENSGPMLNSKTKIVNIPPIFRNIKKIDVSDQYFKTSDLVLKITKPIPPKTYFAYLCVFGNDQWKPVNWGILNNGNMTFKKMGRGIVYLPIFYKNGMEIPASDAFLLKEDGTIKYLDPGKETMQVQLTRKSSIKPHLEIYRKCFIGGTFEISNTHNFQSSKIIYKITDQLNPYPNIFQLKQSFKSRFVRFIIPTKKDALAELAFYSFSNGHLTELKGKTICPDNKEIPLINNAFDHNILSYIELSKINKEHKNLKQYWVGLDFGKAKTINAVGICPRNDKNNIFPGLNYELFFWNDRWISLGQKKANSYNLEFENVPKNSLLLLKCLDEGIEHRIFTYEEGKQFWW